MERKNTYTESDVMELLVAAIKWGRENPVKNDPNDYSQEDMTPEISAAWNNATAEKKAQRMLGIPDHNLCEFCGRSILNTDTLCAYCVGTIYDPYADTAVALGFLAEQTGEFFLAHVDRAGRVIATVYERESEMQNARRKMEAIGLTVRQIDRESARSIVDNNSRK
jgi:hypothetical protein